MPVEFLTDEQAARYAAYRGAPSRAELERFFLLDDADRELIEGKRRAHNRLEAMWERIEQVAPRHELAAAIAALFELAPPLDSDADEAWRAQLVTRFGTVRPF